MSRHYIEDFGVWTCKTENCSKTTEEYREYCREHQNICQARGCSIRVYYNYCSRHQRGCQESGCSQRVDSYEKYCSNHSFGCKEGYCSGRVGSREDYCSWHSKIKKICQATRCSRAVFRETSYCWWHSNNCQFDGCGERLSDENRYCYQHSPVCQEANCSCEVTGGGRYCSSHGKSCDSCSARISNGVKYCSGHMNSCYLCSVRISSQQVYCSSCENRKREENLKNSVKQKISALSNPQEVVQFETWWNKNLATVVNGNYSYTVWLLVYVEPEIRKFETNSSNYNLDETKNKAGQLRSGLNGENPILYIHPSANSFASFSELIKSSYVVSINLPPRKRSSTMLIPSRSGYGYHDIKGEVAIPNDSPSSYLKPLDIVKVKREAFGNKFYHFGIYLGSNQVCHYSDPDSKKSTLDNRVRITSWETFVRGCVDGEVVGYRPIIPFKHFQGIARNIAWDEANRHGDRKYCLANNNCEHYVNSRIFGLNYSKQVEERPTKSSENSHRQGIWNYAPKCYECRQGKVNNGESGIFCLRDRLNQSLNQTNNDRSQEIERQYLQEIPAKDNNCRIM